MHGPVPTHPLPPMAHSATKQSGPRRIQAFTLIELLIVIAIIAILASMVFPITKALARTKVRTRIAAEMTQLETAIQSYKAKLGIYPPDNPANPMINQLFYELKGTVFTNTGGSASFYRTLDGTAQLSADPATFQTYFGAKVNGLMNTTRAAGDEGVFAGNFL